MRLVIKGKMPGFNKITNSNRTNMYAGAKLKKQWTERVAWACKEQNLGKAEEPVKLKFIWYEPNRRRDPDNFTSAGRKLILDGLQQTGVLENDGWKNIKSFSDEWHLDKNNPRVEVFINKGDER